MYSTAEELIPHHFERDLETGAFKFEILTNSKRETDVFELKENVVYEAAPLHYKWMYLFRLHDSKLHYFKIKKEQKPDMEVTFVVVLEQKKITKQLSKMLDRADFMGSDEEESIAMRYAEFKQLVANDGSID